MTNDEALKYVHAEIERIEKEHPNEELRPWERDACSAATEHWRRVQQRIALTTSRGSTSCLDEFKIAPDERKVRKVHPKADRAKGAE